MAQAKSRKPRLALVGPESLKGKEILGVIEAYGIARALFGEP
jgi:hypothetical protein